MTGSYPYRPAPRPPSARSVRRPGRTRRSRLSASPPRACPDGEPARAMGRPGERHDDERPGDARRQSGDEEGHSDAEEGGRGTPPQELAKGRDMAPTMDEPRPSGHGAPGSCTPGVG